MLFLITNSLVVAAAAAATLGVTALAAPLGLLAVSGLVVTVRVVVLARPAQPPRDTARELQRVILTAPERKR